MELIKKAAYLKGLMDGLAIDNTTSEGKVLLAMQDLLNEICDTVADMDDDLSQVYDELDAMDEDMDDLEEAVFGEDYDDDDDEDDEDEDEDDAEIRYELTCPNCGASTVVDEETLMNEKIVCGNCGAEFEIELEECGEGCDCGCEEKDED